MSISGISPSEKKHSSSPALYCVIGHPVEHSLSPMIMNHAFKAVGIDAQYSITDSNELGLVQTVEDLKTRGYAGWNVTMPDKTNMCALVDELSDESKIAQSVNTVKNMNGFLYGTTTDGEGFLYAAGKLGITLPGKKITLLGAGGAASAILIVSSLHHAKEISVFCRSNRSKARAQVLSEKLSDISDTHIRICSFSDPEELQYQISESVLLVNATNVGMGDKAGFSLIPDESYLLSRPAVFDVIYSPSETILLKTAKKAGCRTANGLPMLFGQAAESFRLWTGKEMPPSSVILSS